VRALAGEGATVIGVDLAAEGADELAAAAAEAGGSFSLEQADITDRGDLDRLVERLGEERHAPHVLVNNAGIDQPPDASAGRYAIDEVPLGDFMRTLEVNVGGAFNMTQAFGTQMADAGRGAIVNIGSLYAAIAPEPEFYSHLGDDPPFLKPPAYGASKAALVNLTRYFARLWGERGVRVNALSPGGVRGDQDDEFLRKYCARVPLGRMADPDDLTGPLLFLATDESRYVTGHELRVDGGFTA
jgi:NAD(P)-dependent dehydrogenase (short-subunit alcohol dehydrogenase family)